MIRRTRTLRPHEISLEGIVTEVEMDDSTLKRITFTDRAGKVVTIENYVYNLRATTLAPPPTVKKYEVRGTQFDQPYTARFDEKYLAQNAADHLRNDGHGEFTVHEIEVPEEVEA